MAVLLGVAGEVIRRLPHVGQECDRPVRRAVVRVELEARSQPKRERVSVIRGGVRSASGRTSVKIRSISQHVQSFSVQRPGLW